MPAITIQNAGTTWSVTPPSGRNVRTPVNTPRMPIQRVSSPTRIAASDVAIVPAAMASPAIRAG